MICLNCTKILSLKLISELAITFPCQEAFPKNYTKQLLLTIKFRVWTGRVLFVILFQLKCIKTSPSFT